MKEEEVIKLSNLCNFNADYASPLKNEASGREYWRVSNNKESFVLCYLDPKKGNHSDFIKFSKCGFNKINLEKIYQPERLNFYSIDNDKICDLELTKFNTKNSKYTTLQRSTLIEFLNRLLGVIAGLATLLMLFFSFSYWKEKKILVLISFAIVFGMGFQAWLGKLVVDSNLAPYKITTHMPVSYTHLTLPTKA